jgi:hypothetical protein
MPQYNFQILITSHISPLINNYLTEEEDGNLNLKDSNQEST